eukprot:6267974-Pyramimonas_sp.AAC.1
MAPSPWWRPVETLTLIARLGRRADAQVEPTGQMAHAGIQCARVARTFAISVTRSGCVQSVAQWTSTTAHISSCDPFRTRPGWRRLTLRGSV